ncbi:DUF2075 domain-containing protein [Leuconostoc suionicum]|uniref:DUF2075 domain-containing protein n=1 Tax=Leuconostoc suionicum TaxID=1511761 RepID=UPI00403670B2
MFMEKNSFILSDEEKLSTEQAHLIQNVVDFANQGLKQGKKKVFIIEGGAGSGKSVVLFEIFKQLQHAVLNDESSALYQTNNYLLVNHAEIWKIYRDLAGKTEELKKKQFLKPTTFIHQMDKEQRRADIVLIDEAHLLLTEPDRYNKFNQTNQLVEIIKRSQVIILVFDSHQVLKFKSMWTNQRLEKIVSQYAPTRYQLSNQYRMLGNNEHIVQWIDNLTQNKEISTLGLVDGFDFQIFSNANDLYRMIQQQNKRVGMSRLLATTDYPYTVNRGTWYVTVDDFKLPWDQLDTGITPWALRPETINEVGSVYTIQGFDLNYAGVIIGPSITFDEEKNKIVVHTEKYEDNAAFRQTKGHSFSEQEKEAIMLNALNVLLKRGRQGLYICAADHALRRKLAMIIKK